MRYLVKVVVVVVVAGLLSASPQALAGRDEATQPEDGGSRVGHLFPQEGIEHLPSAMLEHGVPHALPNLDKDPRSDTAHEALTTPPPE